MQVSPNLDTVCHAIYTLYHDSDSTGKEQASSYLNELQKSVYAWKVADDILQHKTDLESCYFAAQTIKIKVQLSFHELPVKSQPSLRDSLLNHISKVTAETGAIIVTQLCLAVTHLALQMATWKNPVDDLISKLGNEVHQVQSLLEILTFLPEELTNRNLRLGENRRNEVTFNLREETPKVLELLNSCVQSFGQSDSGILRKVFRCLSSWFAIRGIFTSDPRLISMIACGFQILSAAHSNSMLHEAATDAICSALLVAEDIHNNQALAEVLFQGVYALVEAFHTSVAQEDADKVINYCRIFTELAESFLDQVVEFPNMGFGNLQNLDLLLICVGHHDYEVAEITFNYWYRLSEALYKKDNASLNQVFEPYVQRLIAALYKHCQLEQDHEGVPEECDDFAEFRKRVSDLIKDFVFIIGSDKCFQQMFDNLKNQGTSATWDATESSLFVMSAVAKNIIPEENAIVPQVLEAILHLPDSSHMAVRYTSIHLVGELCSWIEKHPQYLEHALNFLLKGLQQPALASISAIAVKNICSTCKKQMVSHFPGLLQVLQVIDRLSISNEATENLLKGAALILGEMPNEKITNGLRELCQTQLTPLSEVLRATDSHPKAGSKTDPVVWLDRLAAMFRNTSPKVVNGQVHPCQPVVEDVWPLLSETCNKYKSDTRVIERCCRCIRFIVRCVGKQSALLLQPLVQQMVELYQQHQHSCFLYLGSVLVDEFASEPGCIQGLLDMLQAFCGPTFLMLQQPNGLRDHPDTVDDLFRLCTRFLQWTSVPFLQSPAVKPVLECAILACSLDHKDANISVMKFFQDLIKSHDEKPVNLQQRNALVHQLLAEYGQNIMSALIRSSIYHLPMYMLVNISAVLYELVIFNKESFSKWLQVALLALPTQSIGGSVTATPEQLSEFHRNVLGAQHMKTVTASLREFSRLYR